MILRKRRRLMARLYNSRCECTGFGIPFDDSNANTDLIAPWGSTLDIAHGYSMEPGPCERKKACIDFGAAKTLHCSNMLISDTTDDETEHECEFKLGDSSQTLQPPLANDDLPTPALALDLGMQWLWIWRCSGSGAGNSLWWWRYWWKRWLRLII